MIFKPVLVQFNNEKWGIRLGWWFGWRFQDFDYTATTYGRLRSSKNFKDCMTTYEKAADRWSKMMVGPITYEVKQRKITK